MMKILFFTVLSINAWICFGQQREVTNHDSAFERCNIKSVKYVIVKYDQGNIKDSIFNYQKYYNESGLLTKIEFPSRYGFNCRIEYTYNELGYLVDTDSSGLFGWGTANFGDSLIYEECIVYRNIGGEKKVIEKTSNIQGDSIASRTAYEYFDSGDLLKEKHFSTINNEKWTLKYCVIYRYLKCGILDKKVHMDSEEKIISKHLMIYEYY